MDRPITTLFMLMSVDGKISTGATDDLDIDKDFPKIAGVREGLHQYYGIPAKCPRRNKGVKLYLLRFTPEKLMTNEDGSIGGFSHTFVCGVRKAPDEVFHELDKALQLLQKNAAVDILFQRGDVLEADSEFGTHTWEYTGDSWNPRFQLNPAQVKNIPKGALHNAR